MKDITGERFGRLVALGPVGRNKGGNVRWLCQCDCGQQTVVAGGSLRNGNTQSCGCLNRERHTTHGMEGTREYSTWQSMIARCTNPNRKGYKDYGGRGITVYGEWRSFEKWHEHVSALPHAFEDGYTMDRIDNGLGYIPGNIRWATARQQHNNTRTNRYLEFNGKRQTMAQWARELGMNYATLWSRIARGWTAKRALATPARR
jgi:beta-galactosidase/beta-glucuronidase